MSDSLAIGTTERQRHVVDLEQRTWLSRHRDGDARAFPALMAAYRRPVYSYLVRTGVADADRDDVFQTIFLRIHAAAESYDSSEPLAPWLFTIVANTVRNHARAGASHLRVVADDDPPDAPDPSPSPERATAARQTLARLENLLKTLPSAQREVLLLITIAGLPQQAVADALEIPLNTVKTHLRRARLALVAGLACDDAPTECAGDSHDQV
jgi:RNA polymerase sigma-70 factor (ECF subfamily)